MSNLHELSEQIFEIRGKCTDEEYKNLMDSLKKLYDEQQKKQQSRLVLELDDLGELEPLDPLDDVEQQNIHKHTKFGLVVKPQKINTDCCTIM